MTTNAPLSDEEIGGMERLEKAATKEPWLVELDDNEQPNIWNFEERWIALLPHQCVTEIEKQANADAAFIAAARSFVPRALEEIRWLHGAMTADAERLRDAER